MEQGTITAITGKYDFESLWNWIQYNEKGDRTQTQKFVIKQVGIKKEEKKQEPKTHKSVLQNKEQQMCCIHRPYVSCNEMKISKID